MKAIHGKVELKLLSHLTQPKTRLSSTSSVAMANGGKLTMMAIVFAISLVDTITSLLAMLALIEIQVFENRLYAES